MVDKSVIAAENTTLENIFDFYGHNNSLFDISADFDIQAILNEFPDLYGQTKTKGREWNAMTISLMVLYSIAFLLGILGNIFVIAVVAQYKHMRTLTNVFLVNLTIGDLLVVLICIPITLGEYVYEEYIFGTIMCKLAPFFQGTAVAVSALSLLFIGINRYIAIHRPLKAKIIFSKRKIYMMLASVWVLSFSAFIPLLVVNHVTVLDFGIMSLKKRSCSEGWSSLFYKQFYNVVIFVLLFCMPLMVMIIAYTRIGLTLWGDEGKVFKENARGNRFQAERILQQRRRTVKMLIAVVSIFCICWLPYYIVNIWIDINMSNNSTVFVTTYIYPILQVLGLTNSVVNPICYCFMSNGFRKAFLKLCCKRHMTTGAHALLTIRFKSSEDSPIDSLETATSRDHHDHIHH